jgi:GntR family transcriptional regulator
MVSRDGLLPLHHQIRLWVLEQIESGALKPGERLPTERELADRFQISLAPVRQAMVELARQGLLIRVPHRGTFVAEKPTTIPVDLLGSYSSSLTAQGIAGVLQILDFRRRRASKPVREALGVEWVVFLERVSLIDRRPVALLQASLPYDRTGSLLTQPLVNDSLYQTLEQRLGIIPTRARTVLEVGPATTRESDLLQVPNGHSVLRIHSVTTDQHNHPIEVSDVTYRPDRFRFVLNADRRDNAGRRTVSPAEGGQDEQ